MPPVAPDPVRPGHGRAWPHPGPVVAGRKEAPVRIGLRGVAIVDTARAARKPEVGHPPDYHVPPADIAPGALLTAAGVGRCEWKDRARGFDVVAGGERHVRTKWADPDPTASFAIPRDRVAFRAAEMDACLADGERGAPQARRLRPRLDHVDRRRTVRGRAGKPVLVIATGR